MSAITDLYQKAIHLGLPVWAYTVPLAGALFLVWFGPDFVKSAFQSLFNTNDYEDRCMP